MLHALVVTALVALGACASTAGPSSAAGEPTGLATEGQSCGPGLAACAEGYFCETPLGECGAAQGKCRAIPMACTMQWDPVCGCDGATYGNACAAQGRAVSVRAAGECGAEN